MKPLFALIVAMCLVATATADEIVIKASKVFTLTGEPLSPGSVRIKDGKIVEVAREISTPSGSKSIDLGPGMLLPGLVDAYTVTGLDGGLAESTREVTPEFRVIDGLDWNARSFRLSRSEGITTVLVAPGTDNVFAGLSCVVKTAGAAQQRVLKKEHALMITSASDPASGNSARNRPDSIYARQPTNRMGVTWILRSEFSRNQPSDTGAIRDALDGKRPVICVSRLDCDIHAALRLRQDYPMHLTIAGGHEAYKVRSELAAAKVPVLLGKCVTTTGSGPENSEAIFNNAGLLHEAGVSLALTGGQLLEQMRFAVRHGLPRDAAIAAVTSTPARLLGVENRVGTIAVGKDADLVAFSGDPFDFTTAVRWTMIDGVIRSEDQ